MYPADEHVVIIGPTEPVESGEWIVLAYDPLAKRHETQRFSCALDVLQDSLHVMTRGAGRAKIMVGVSNGTPRCEQCAVDPTFRH